MPVTRKDVVRSKFLLQLLIVCGSTLAYLVLAALVSLVLRTFEVKAFCNMLFAAWLVLWVVLLMGSVSTLLLFRFPPEYARLPAGQFARIAEERHDGEIPYVYVTYRRNK